MFTQCAKCETVFKLSAEDLRAAGGQVRCGRCGEVFNALARLAEDPSAFSIGESPLEMEARADEILHSTVLPAQSTEDEAPDDLAAADAEFAQLLVVELYGEERRAPEAAPPVSPATPDTLIESVDIIDLAEPAKPAGPDESDVAIGDEDLLQEAALEFTLPPGELDRIFVESRPQMLPLTPAPVGPEPTLTVQDAIEPVETPPNRAGRVKVSESVRREVPEGLEEMTLPEIAVRRRRGLPFAVWLGAAIFLTLCLGAQVIHENRAWIATHAILGSRLGGLYAAIGVALPEAANLSAYQLRQWGVTGDPSANGTLRMRASILNTAAQAQPFPLLRVTLANRFGSRIGTRDFEPAEYLGKPAARLLASGERVDAVLDILDPGNDAEGFELDLCLRGVDKKVRCAADAAAQAKP
ncbi:MAG: DUF3426 domain-containing protein [Steroidobacteraceae bacterium]